VIADAHAEGLGFRGDLVEPLGQVEPVLGVLGLEAGDDKEGIPQNGVQLGRGLQVVAGNGFEVGMRAAALEAVPVEEPPQFLGLAVPAVVAGKLDALLAHFTDGLEDGRQVFLRRLADGVELDADRDLFLGGPGLGRRGPEPVQADQSGSGPDGGGSQEITTRKSFPFDTIHVGLLHKPDAVSLLSIK
jgi:hypothetical protein